MEEWQLDFEWLKVRHYLKEKMKLEKLPDVNAVLLLIGVQELGQPKSSFTKEEKQDLMHIALCKLMSFDGIYEFEGLDDEGWPHWRLAKKIDKKGEVEQGAYIKSLCIRYFNDIID